MAKKHPTRKWPFKYVEVIWKDIVSCHRWCSTLKPSKLATIHERGWLIEDNDEEDCITIASQLREIDKIDQAEEPDDIYEMGMSTTIPKGCIISMKEMK